MNTRREFLLGMGAALLLTTGTQAQTPLNKTAVPTPTEVVQQYLTARTAHDYAQAYGLFSAAVHQQIPFAQFSDDKSFPEAAAHAGKDGFSPIMLAIGALFMDLHGVMGYRFSVTDPDPSDPHTVLVRALPPHGATPDGILLKIVTTPAADAGGAPRIELLPSFQKTSPVEAERAREQAQRATSLSNLHQIGLAAIQYAVDHDEHFPHADHWVDELLPYTQTASIFRDPSAPEGQNYGYAFNRNLSGLSLAKVASPAALVMFFESTKGVKNASDAGQSVPRPGRHIGGTDYAFADGHVKWLPDGARLSYLPGDK